MIEKASSRESILQRSGSWEEVVYEGKANHSSFLLLACRVQFEMVKTGGGPTKSYIGIIEIMRSGKSEYTLWKEQ